LRRWMPGWPRLDAHARRERRGLDPGCDWMTPW
jgi:hypothetical protein